jgi:hypothetical protein
LEIEAAKVGLKINEQKTKYMIAARNDKTICDVGQRVAIGDKHFEVVKEFVYLGSLMTPSNDLSLEIQRRIQTANRCFFGLRNNLIANRYVVHIVNNIQAESEISISNIPYNTNHRSRNVLVNLN